jgi:hypothetical protein
MSGDQDGSFRAERSVVEGSREGTCGSREAILARIREALREPAPRHHETGGHRFHDAQTSTSTPGENIVAVTAPFREWLPRVGDSKQERIECFARLSEMLKTEFVPCTTVAAATKHIAALAADQGWKRLATHAGN